MHPIAKLKYSNYRKKRIFLKKLQFHDIMKYLIESFKRINIKLERNTQC